MSGAFGKVLHLAVVCGAVALYNAVAGQDATLQSASRPPPNGDDEIIVYGSLPELRRQLRHTRDAMFLRFNEINSDDRFDIHCYVENAYRLAHQERTLPLELLARARRKLRPGFRATDTWRERSVRPSSIAPNNCSGSTSSAKSGSGSQVRMQRLERR